jgi:hypothetical protein
MQGLNQRAHAIGVDGDHEQQLTGIRRAHSAVVMMTAMPPATVPPLAGHRAARPHRHRAA